MKLTIKEKLALQQMLPREGSLQEQITVESIVKKTTVTRKDVEEAAGKTNRLSSNKQLLNFYYHGRKHHKDTKYICTTQFQLSLFSPCHSSF